MALLLLAASACTVGASNPDPALVLRNAAHALGTVKTVTADVKFGPGITFDTFGLASATAKLKLPGDSDTDLKVKQQDFLVDIRLVTVGGRTYLKLPFGSFAQLTAEQAAALPQLTLLLDPNHGLPVVLTQARNPRYDGSESVAGHDSDRVLAVFTADQVGAVLGAVKPAGDVTATVWAGKDDHLIRKVLLSGPLMEAGKNTTVEIGLRNFNAPLEILKPV